MAARGGETGGTERTSGKREERKKTKCSAKFFYWFQPATDADHVCAERFRGIYLRTPTWINGRAKAARKVFTAGPFRLRSRDGPYANVVHSRFCRILPMSVLNSDFSHVPYCACRWRFWDRRPKWTKSVSCL